MQDLERALFGNNHTEESNHVIEKKSASAVEIDALFPQKAAVRL